MFHVKRYILVVIVAFALSGYSGVDANYYRYRVDVGQGSYNIGIYDYTVYDPVPAFKRELRELRRDIECGFPSHTTADNSPRIARVPDMVEKMNRLKQQRSQNRYLNAQTELLEAQTALAQYQLRQAKRANRQPYRPPSEAQQRAARKRLVQNALRAERQSSKKRQPSTPVKTTKYRDEVDVMVEIVRLGVLDAQTALSRYAKRRTPQEASRLRAALIDAGFYGKSTKRVRHREYLRDLDAEVNQLTLHPLAGK